MKGKQATSNADVTAGNASKNVSDFVKDKIDKEYGTAKTVGLATIVATDDGATITISTTDWKQEGNVADTGGTLTWGDLVQNIPTPAPVEDTGGDPTAANSVQTLAKKGTIQVGDSVNYNPGTATSTGLALPAGASIDGTISASNAEEWVVLDVDNTTGEVLIVTRSYLNSTIVLTGKDGYNNVKDTLDLISGIYKNDDYAKSARSITIGDLEKVGNCSIINGYPEETEDVTFHHRYGFDTTTLYITDSNDENTSRTYNISNDPSDSYYTNNCGELFDWRELDFWVPARYIRVFDYGGDESEWDKGCRFYLANYCDGNIYYRPLNEIINDNPDTISELQAWSSGILPVISLKSGLQMTKDGNDVWQLTRGNT